MLLLLAISLSLYVPSTIFLLYIAPIPSSLSLTLTTLSHYILKHTLFQSNHINTYNHHTPTITTMNPLHLIILILLSLLASALASAIPRSDNLPTTCAEGTLKCLAANDNGKAGGVFKCVGGYWDEIQACSLSEHCVSSPVPHCEWARGGADGF
jgi:hypothetical protein